MEETKKTNPADLNGDGKVTFSEQVQYTAGKVMDKAKEVAADAKVQLDELGDKVEGKYAELKEKAESGELKEKAQAALASAKEKGSDLFDKAKAKGAELAEKAKEKLKEKKEA